MQKQSPSNKSFFYLVLIIFTLAITLLNLFAQNVLAAESTPSADIKTALDQLEKEIASKAAKLKSIVDQKLKDKAYIGKIKAKSDQSFTISANSGPKIISINQDTLFESQIKKKSKASLSNLTQEDDIAALGDIDETAVMTARKVILLPGLEPETKTYLWGQIIAVSDKLATLKDKDSKNIAVLLPADNNIKLMDFVILTGSKNKNDIFAADFAYVTSQKGFIKAKKIATPSASLKPQPTPKSATNSGKPAKK